MILSIVLTNLWASLENIAENLVSSTEGGAAVDTITAEDAAAAGGLMEKTQ